MLWLSLGDGEPVESQELAPGARAVAGTCGHPTADHARPLITGLQAPWSTWGDQPL